MLNGSTGRVSVALAKFMNKKSWILIVIALALAVVYACFFANWFKPGTLQIYHTSRNTRPMMRPRPGTAAAGVAAQLVTFGFEREYKLTEIKVIPLKSLQTNQYPEIVWHLVSDSNSVPIKHFNYGQGIRGMKPEVPGVRPQPLQPNVTYRLFVQAGSLKGQHDFQAVTKPANSQ
jgi:hypothetical protein